MSARAAAILARLAEGGSLSQRVMIIAAHPDDETIGIGAQFARFGDALLVHATDGAPRDGRDAEWHGFTSRARYAAARRRELADALAAAEAPGVRTARLDFPDREACRNLVVLTQRVHELIRRERPVAVFTHPYEGGHPDHDAVAFAVHGARRLAGAGEKPAIVEMALYHAAGEALATGVFLPGATPVIELVLGPESGARKARMIDCFRSQRVLLQQFKKSVERLREAPQYDFTQPPHTGELHYERLGWGIDGADWRRAAAAALATLGFAQCR